MTLCWEPIRANDVEEQDWQVCDVCDGLGWVATGFGGVDAGAEECEACDGLGRWLDR